MLTGMFTSRRVCSIFLHELGPISVAVIIRPEPDPESKVERWWQSQYSVIVFQNEVLKYAYYRLKY